MKAVMKLTEKELERLYGEIEVKFSERKYEQVFLELERFIPLAKDCNSIKYQGLGFGLKGYTYYLCNEIYLAIKCFEFALSYFVKQPDLLCDEIKQNKNSLGVLYRLIGNGKKSIQSLMDSIEISDKYGLTNSTAYNNIANLFSNQKNYQKALLYLEIAVKKESNSENKKMMYDYLTNIAMVHTKNGNFKKATKIFQKNIKYFEEREVLESLIQNLKGYSIICIEYGNFIEARIHLEQAKNLSHQIQYKYHLVDIHLSFAQVYEKSNDYENQLSSLQIALKTAEASNTSKVALVLAALVKYYQHQNMFLEASETIKKLIGIIEAKFRREKEEKFLELQEAFESKQKDKLIQREHDFQVSLKVKQKELLNALLEQKGLELHLKSLQLQLSPRFIFSTLQSIQSFIFERDPFQASDYLAKFAGLMRAILKASRNGSLSLLEEKQILEQYLELEQERFNHSFRYQIEVDEMLKLEEQIVPALLIQPFVENAVLHGVASLKNGIIRVVFRKGKDKLYVHIIDNGVGRVVSENIYKNNRTKTSTALQIMRERETLSKDIKGASLNFKIIDLESKGSPTGTHVILRIAGLFL